MSLISGCHLASGKTALLVAGEKPGASGLIKALAVGIKVISADGVYHLVSDHCEEE